MKQDGGMEIFVLNHGVKCRNVLLRKENKFHINSIIHEHARAHTHTLLQRSMHLMYSWFHDNDLEFAIPLLLDFLLSILFSQNIER